ncbi:hypothetical protein BDN67DRAFT_985099 [Paxillus ammoniavirescens]|nr:hypothetical protein BDN67DRAFT_985099 [Paxillus ammoniavirescens]
MIAQLDQNVTSTQQQVEARYWRMVVAISKLILIKDHTKFNKTLMEKELTPAWEIVFTPGQHNAWLLCHLFSIMYCLREAYDHSDATLNVCTIPKYDLVFETTRIFEKGYLINNKDITSDIPLGEDLWWQEFYCKYFEMYNLEIVVKRVADKVHTADKEVAAEKKVKVKAEMGKAQTQEQSNVPGQGGPSGLKIRVK